MEHAYGGVLVLNASYEPLNIVSVRRAIVLLLKEKAEVVEAAKAQVRAERMALDLPLVIRLVAYVPLPRRLPLPLSRRTVLARDLYTCQDLWLSAGASRPDCGSCPPTFARGRDQLGERSGCLRFLQSAERQPYA